MIRKVILFLSIVFVIAAFKWILDAPDQLEPKITFLGGLIALLTAYFSPKVEARPIEVKSSNSSKKFPNHLGNSISTPDSNSNDIIHAVAYNSSEGNTTHEVSPTVFISYAHDSESHKQQALELADNLNGLGIDCWIDRYVEDNPPKRGWPMWMEERIRLSSFILLVCSERYLARVEGREDKSKGRGVKFESILLVQSFYDNDSTNEKIIPILFSKEDESFIPTIFRPFTNYCVSSEDQFDKLYRRLTNQPEIVKPKVGKIKNFKSRSLKREGPPRKTTNEIPQFDEFKNNMKQAHKIMQSYLSLPVTRRFEIARKLGLLEPTEDYNSPNKDQITMMVLVRAKNKNKMAELWSQLFNESIDPNPFKK